MGGRAGKARQAIGLRGWRGRERRDRRLHCGAQRTGGAASDRGWQVLLPRPVPVNDTTLTSTRLGARAFLVVASNESGYEWSGREVGG